MSIPSGQKWLLWSISWMLVPQLYPSSCFWGKYWLMKHATGFCSTGQFAWWVSTLPTVRGCCSFIGLPRNWCRPGFHDLSPKVGCSYAQDYNSCLLIGNQTFVMKHILWHWQLQQHLVLFTEVVVPNEFGCCDSLSAKDDTIWWCIILLLWQLSTQWLDVQAQFLELIQSCSSGGHWTIASLEKLWDIWWYMWEQRNYTAHDTLLPQRLASSKRCHGSKWKRFLTKEVKVSFHETSGCLPKVLTGAPTDPRCWIYSGGSPLFSWQESAEPTAPLQMLHPLLKQGGLCLNNGSNHNNS